MISSELPEPVLCVDLDAIEKIQGGEDALGALWSVFTKVKDSVTDGRRLENMSWRLWHRARIAPQTPQRQFTRAFSRRLPGYPEMPPRPLSSPSLSFSSSSEATSSDWDRDTAIGDDEESQNLNVPGGARRSSAVSPLTEKTRLDLVPGTDVSQARANQIPSPASSSRSCHQFEPTPAVARVRISPSAPSDYTPQYPPQAAFDAETDACCEGISLSGSQHQGVNPAQSIAGLEAPSSNPHDSISPRTCTPQCSTIAPNPSSTFSCTATTSTSTPDPNPALFATGILAATVTSSSMPITLPSGPRKGTWSVGRIIAELFPDKVVVSAPSTAVERARDVHSREEGRLGIREEPSAHTPQIVEPQPSTPPSSSTSMSSWLHLGSDSSPTPNSAVTSATSTPRQTFPTVVVVNPTPHPTPPPTPSPGTSDGPLGLRPTATPFDRPEDNSGDWRGGGAENGQLATPVSLNGDGRISNEPELVMIESKTQPLKEMQLHAAHLGTSSDVAVFPLYKPLLPAAAITLPERPTDFPSSSHLPTPSSDSPYALQISERANSSKASPAPISAPVPSEEKKFFLEAPHSGSGGSGPESSESPGSLGVGSVSPDKSPLVGMGQTSNASRVAAPISQIPSRQNHLSHDEELASSMSASSPPGPSPSISSSRGGSSKHKLRSAFGVASGSRRKQGTKKVVLVTKQGPKNESDVDLGEPPAGVKAKEQAERLKAKGKEREVGERIEASALVQGLQTTASTKTVQQHSQSRQQQPLLQNLRQLPTNPPRPHASDASRTNISQNTSTNPPPNTRQPPNHPQLSHIGLGHLPTVPPRLRRPIEITETSSECETTDTDDSSWESESCSDEETCERDAQADPSGPKAEVAEPSTKKVKISTVGANNRTRDAGAFARDAALESQRRKELFQKLPSRSYSHLSQLPRIQSGLSQLFRPNPELFPQGHPYRTSRSSHDILARNWSAPAPPLALTNVSKRGTMVGPMQASVNAEPVISNVNSKPDRDMSSGGLQRGYRPRGKPEGQDEETETDDDPEDTIQVASSVAQRRLAALMGQRPASKQQQQQRPPPSRSTSHPEAELAAPGPQPMSRTSTMPVLMHPYLPDPAPLQTPHTVRRNIISQELDEELRRNLLWERSQNQIQGRPPRAAGSILPGPWRPLTAVKPEEARETQSNASDKGPGKRPFATQRTKSWAGDYHASGW